MVRFDYLVKGLSGLAKAHRAGPMAGHLGAAVVAGYFLGEDVTNLPAGVYRAIEAELDRIMRGEETVWFDPKKMGVTVPQLFEPMVAEPPQAALIPQIAEALSRNIGQLRQSGHNVIFAAAALRSLHDHPQFAPPSCVAGICKLIEAFNNASPGRGYYGRQRGWQGGEEVILSQRPPIAPYRSLSAMTEIVVNELIHGASIRRRGFGGLFHIINHAAGLIELSAFGYKKLAETGLAAHHRHVCLWRTLPDVSNELGPLQKAEHDPRTVDYWSRKKSVQWSAWLTHRIKTLYGFFTLMRFVEDVATRKQAERALLYLMA
ncbi:MAG: hypothetical protein GXP27_06490 [Planctomycetes bacterium]|nr:hypothetical protein [Planctomycetota bacterium]